MSLAEVMAEQRRLAYHAAPTAVAINMHLYWVGVASDLWRAEAWMRQRHADPQAEVEPHRRGQPGGAQFVLAHEPQDARPHRLAVVGGARCDGQNRPAADPFDFDDQAEAFAPDRPADDVAHDDVVAPVRRNGRRIGTRDMMEHEILMSCGKRPATSETSTPRSALRWRRVRTRTPTTQGTGEK